MRYFNTYALPYNGELIPIWQLQYREHDECGDFYVLPNGKTVSQQVKLLKITWDILNNEAVNAAIVVEHYQKPKYLEGSVVYRNNLGKLYKDSIVSYRYVVESETIKPYESFDEYEQEYYNLPKKEAVIHLKIYKPEYTLASGTVTTSTYNLYTIQDD